ncbi:non-hydrolyzing UDP-N-acetylglucosamine 2-epimerase [Gracilimonas sp.]|uniref:non-hydrolyzing UDP-N-acetylglucosamine 2-epimerase n=1 Tax=Gracilimonas sp. TaxID=1974203 RepID=UPI00287219AB|nr:UDP-N-acetylglucosamine 2-epimerase (non-hydrolyzing) [Gracilimonas sp.]
MKKILISFGTRPEVIKLAPVIKALENEFELTVVHTGQHLELAQSMFELFDIKPDINLDIMKPNQDLFSLTADLLPRLKSILQKVQPDYVMVQGDTTSSYLSALAAFYLNIPVLHVEAGLRSHNMLSPFPEEMNRRQISVISHFHFAPTPQSKANLIAEGVPELSISITGNTVIDALHMIKNSETYAKARPEILAGMNEGQKLGILTAHRRENHGKPLDKILKAANQLIEEFKDLILIFPMHPNPNVKRAIEAAEINSSRFIITEPYSYLPFLHLLSASDLIMTDSGGIQEEAAALGKPVLVLREETERMELIEANIGTLVGHDIPTILKHARSILASETNIDPSDVFGDGKAAQRIKEVLINQL